MASAATRSGKLLKMFPVTDMRLLSGDMICKVEVLERLSFCSFLGDGIKTDGQLNMVRFQIRYKQRWLLIRVI